MIYENFKKYQSQIKHGEISLLKTVEDFLERIEEHKDLNVFLEVYADEAIADAKVIEEKNQKWKRR